MSGWASDRRLLLAAALPIGLGVFGFGALWGPWSPLALDAADARYLTGDAESALVAYAAIADGWYTPTTRAQAATRAGLLALQRGDANTAVAWLRRALALEPEAGERAALGSRLAGLYLDTFGDPARAAEAWEQVALDLGTAAGGALASAATCWERAERPDRAREAWIRASAVLRLSAETDGSAREVAQAGLERVEAALTAAALTATDGA